MSKLSEQYQRRIEELVARFETELDHDEWATRRYPKRLRDESKSRYEAPALYLQKGPIKLLLDPTGYDIPGTEGVADLYLMPTYDPMVYLVFEDGKWVIDHTFPFDPENREAVIEARSVPLTTETLNMVLNTIAEHAVPSV